MICSAVVGIKTVDVDPLDNSVWAEDFAVVETSSLGFPEVSWSGHIWSINYGLGLLGIWSQRNISPKP